MSIGDILSSGIMFVSEQTIHPQYHHEEVYVRCASLFDTTVHYVVLARIYPDDIVLHDNTTKQFYNLI